MSVETPVPVAREGRGRLPGDLDMWVMVLGDLVIFGGYFVVYMVFRALRPEAFAVAQQGVHVGAGVVNTVVLLTSSMFMALGVIAAREGRSRAAGRLVLATAGCGVVFVLVKAWEWQATIAAGHTVADEFFSFYFVFIGVHLAHVLLGLLILGVVVRELRDPRKRRQGIVEQGAVYWHLVDLLWVVIFAVLYLMR